jgi:HSP20 family protein
MAEQEPRGRNEQGAVQGAGQPSGTRETGGGSARGTGSSTPQGHEFSSGGDRERSLEVSREGGRSGERMQRGARGSSVAGRGGQAQLLPAFMSNPGLMASAFMSNPFAFAQAMSQEMDRIFGAYGDDDLWSTSGARRGGAATGSTFGRRGEQQSLQRSGGAGLAQWAPQMELYQRGNELVLSADLPGIKPDDVHIDLEDGVLTVSGERRHSEEDRQEGFYRSERSYGSFARSIALPEGVDEDRVNARFENGVLEVTIPMPEQQKQRGRRVQIQSAGQQAGSQAQQLSGGGRGSEGEQSRSTGEQSAGKGKAQQEQSRK